MRNIKNRSIAIFYTCGTCNLKCTYCGIDKNPILAKIDKALEESFKGDYYFNQVQKYFPYPDQLKRIETWGGEPFLGMDRIIRYIKLLNTILILIKCIHQQIFLIRNGLIKFLIY